MAIVRALMWAVVAAAAISLPGPADAQPRERLPCCEDALDYNWSGILVGGHAAVARSNLDLNLATPADGAEHGDTAFGGGLQVAFQRQWGRMVAGVEVSYTWVDLSDSNASAPSPGTTFASSISDLLVVAGKLGYAQDRFLAFAKAGYASAEVELRCSACGAVGGVSTSDREHGWMMGIGIDYAMTDKIIVGVEYNWLFLDVDQRVLGTSTVDASSDVQTVMARLMLKFGGH